MAAFQSPRRLFSSVMPLTKAEISRLRSLQEKKHREAEGLFVVEGEKVVGELLAAKFPFVEIYATDQVEGDLRARLETVQRPGSTRVVSVTAAEMARMSHYPTPSNVLAIGKIERRTLAPGVLDRGLTLALDGIQDPGNVGTLLRLADWFALDRVLLSPDCADLFSQKVVNASMGSFARVTVFTAPLVEALAGTKTAVLGCDLQGDDVHQLPAMRDAVIVIGSEGRGISPDVAARLTRRVTIPRYGAKCDSLGGAKSKAGGMAESLNAAIAAAIVCDNLRRAR